MPLFMDRHDDPGVTPKAAAEAHLMDVRIQDKYNCRSLTYWVDVAHGHAFCLFEAPDKEAVLAVHKNSHGSIPCQIIEVEERLVKLFLGRLADPEGPGSPGETERYIDDTALRTIMCLEMRHVPVAPRERRKGIATESLAMCTTVLRDALQLFQGREVEGTTDGFIATFSLVRPAVDCAVAIREDCARHNSSRKESTTDVAIGISTGSPVTASSGFFSDSIRLAQHLCTIARDGQIVLSASARDTYGASILETPDGRILQSLRPEEEGFLTQLMEVVEQEWNNERFGVEDFSRKIGLSKAQLYRKVTSLTGHSVNAFVRNYRLRKARQLIRKGSNIAETAFASGFSNASYFSKCFKKKFGILPSEYARML